MQACNCPSEVPNASRWMVAASGTIPDHRHVGSHEGRVGMALRDSAPAIGGLLHVQVTSDLWV